MAVPLVRGEQYKSQHGASLSAQDLALQTGHVACAGAGCRGRLASCEASSPGAVLLSCSKVKARLPAESDVFQVLNAEGPRVYLAD